MMVMMMIDNTNENKDKNKNKNNNKHIHIHIYSTVYIHTRPLHGGKPNDTKSYVHARLRAGRHVRVDLRSYLRNRKVSERPTARPPSTMIPSARYQDWVSFLSHWASGEVLSPLFFNV